MFFSYYFCSMKRTGIFVFAICCVVLCIMAATHRQNDDGMAALREWRAGSTVTASDVQAFGLEKCFAAEEIPDNVWKRMQGKTYMPNPHISRNDLRHIRVLHWDTDKKIHIGEMVCNKRIAKDLVDIFRQLYNAHYPIQRMVLPDEYDADDERQMRANNTSCFCYRKVAGSQSLSKHALGLAVDLNSLYNPYVKRYKNGSMFIQPSTAAAYCDRKANIPYKIDHNDLAYKLFKQHGFIWGGDWKSAKDYQHFEYRK